MASAPLLASLPLTIPSISHGAHVQSTRDHRHLHRKLHGHRLLTAGKCLRHVRRDQCLSRHRRRRSHSTNSWRDHLPTLPVRAGAYVSLNNLKSELLFRLPLCADGRVHEDEFIAAIKQQISKGKLVQLCIQWNFGQHVDDDAQAKFVETVTAVVDKYGFNGLEMMEFVRARPSSFRATVILTCTKGIPAAGRGRC